MADRRLKPAWRTWTFDQMAVNIAERVEPGECEGERYVGLEHLDTDSLRIRRWGESSDVEGTKLRFRNGDIIFGRRRAYQRKLAVADFDGICSAHAMVLRPRTDVVLPEFLPYFMQSDLFMNRAVEISVGSLSPTINWRTLAKQEFALPPLAEQRRISELLSASANSVWAWQSLETSLDRLYDAFLEYCFVDSRSRGDEHTIKEICDEVTVGIVVNPSRYYVDSGVMAISHGNIHRGEIDTGDVVHFSADAHNELRKTWLHAGDVVLPRVSTLAGRPYYAAVVPDELDGINSIGVVIVRPNRKAVDSGYLEACLNAPSMRRRLVGVAVGSIQRQLNVGIVERESIPIPAYDLQRTFAEISMALKRAIREVHEAVQQQARLRKSLIEASIGTAQWVPRALAPSSSASSAVGALTALQGSCSFLKHEGRTRGGRL